MVNLKNKDIISIKDFTKDELLYLLELSSRIETGDYSELLKGKILANLFFEPSTRTRLSFESAMKRIGGTTIGFDDQETTSVTKGESLSDSVKIIEGYCDVIVLRHFWEGSARLAAESVDIPVINAGDGANQHPTQTFLDLYTVKQTKETLEGLSVGFLGDLKYGRTVHSLAYALSHFNTKMYFVSPINLKMPDEYIDELKNKGVVFVEQDNLEGISKEIDVLYCTRIQKERFADPVEYEKVKGFCKLSKSFIEDLGVKKDLKILHPLPRVDEMDSSLDNTPYGVYFQQAKNGIPVRKAILASVLGAIL